MQLQLRFPKKKADLARSRDIFRDGMLQNTNHAYNCLESIVPRNLERHNRSDSVEVYDAVHDALVLRAGIPVVHQSAASQNKPVLVPLLGRKTHLSSDAHEIHLRLSLWSFPAVRRTLFNACFISQPFLMFSKSSAGRSTRNSEVGEYLIPEMSRPQPSGSPRICTRDAFHNGIIYIFSPSVPRASSFISARKFLIFT